MPIILDGDLGITTPALTVTGATVNTGGISTAGNLTFTSTGNRILGDFSNSTQSNRVLFQTSTTNAATIVGVIPNGTSVTSRLFLNNSSDANNTSVGLLDLNNTRFDIATSLLGTGASLPITISTGGSERMRIDTSGNVGIGISSLTYRLQLVAPTGIWLNFSDGIYQTLRIGNTATGLFYDNPNAGYQAWQIGGSEKMRIEGSNVGIGTATPNGALQVVGESSSLPASNGNLIVSTNSAIAADIGGTIALGGYYTGTSYTQWAGLAGKKDNATDGDYSGYLALYTRLTGAALQERMRIDSSGNVLMRISSPLVYDTNGSADVSGYWNLQTASANSTTAKAIVGSNAVSGIVGGARTNTSGNSVISSFIEFYGLSNTAGSETGQMFFYTKPSGAGASAAARMIINENGYVTTPYQPSFRAGLSSGGVSIAAGANWRFNSVSGGGKHNTGNHYNTSTYQFTAPVAGTYYFHMQVILESVPNNTTKTDMITFLINGVTSGYSEKRAYYVSGSTGDGGYYVDNITAVYKLAANDVVRGINGSGTATQHSNSNYSIFEGYLIG